MQVLTWEFFAVVPCGSVVGEKGQEEEVKRVPPLQSCMGTLQDEVSLKPSLPEAGKQGYFSHQPSSSGCFERGNIQVHWLSNIRNLRCPVQFSREAQLQDLRKRSVQGLQENWHSQSDHNWLLVEPWKHLLLPVYRTTRIHVMLGDNFWGRKKICGLVGWPLTAAKAITDSSPLSMHSSSISLILDDQFC